MSSDTPQTDALEEKCADAMWPQPVVHADFARDLERQLTAARAEIEELREKEALAMRLYETMRDDNVRLMVQIRADSSLIQQRNAEAESLRAKLKEAERDAGRYRFLRQLNSGSLQVYDCEVDPFTSIFSGDLDIAIDAAMQAKEEG